MVMKTTEMRGIRIFYLGSSTTNTFQNNGPMAVQYLKNKDEISVIRSIAFISMTRMICKNSVTASLLLV